MQTTFSRQKKNNGRIRLNQALPNWALLSQYRSGLEVFFENRVHNNLEDDLHVTGICGSGEVRIDHLPRGQVLVLEQVLDVAGRTVNILVTTCMRKKINNNYEHHYMHVSLFLFVCFVTLRPKTTAMVMAGWSVHLTTLFPGQA